MIKRSSLKVVVEPEDDTDIDKAVGRYSGECRESGFAMLLKKRKQTESGWARKERRRKESLRRNKLLREASNEDDLGYGEIEDNFEMQ